MRGFVREVLGVGAWIAAVFVAIWAFPFARPHIREWLGAPDLVDPVTFAAVFVVTLVVLLLVSHWIGALVRGSVLGGLDRTLGLIFGLLRGAALVVFAYIAFGLVVPMDRWPGVVLQARSFPLAYAGAAWATARLPPDYRPKLQPLPAGRETTAEGLSHLSPLGRATDKPVARQ
jgi:membrane protein required for colicin V production